MSKLGHEIVGPGAWKGPEIDWKREGLHELSAAEVQEIDRALDHLKSQGDVDFPDITRENFPLESVGRLMVSLQQSKLFCTKRLPAQT